MASLHGDDGVVIDGNSLVIAETSEMEAQRNNHSEAIESQNTHCEAIESKKDGKRVNSSPAAEESVSDLDECQRKKKMKKASFFDCNICLDIASHDPVVTYCGHLFCWECFYKVRYLNSVLKTRECPVCRGKVTHSSIIPIYRNCTEEEEEEKSDSNNISNGNGVNNIPPRPKGQRAEPGSQDMETVSRIRVDYGQTSRQRSEPERVDGDILANDLSRIAVRERQFRRDRLERIISPFI